MSESQEYENLKNLLAERFYLYQTFYSLVAGEPSIEVLKTLKSDQLSFCLKQNILDEAKMNSFSVFLGDLRKLKMNSELLSELTSEYTRLFIGPQKLVAFPWESVYVNENRLLMQESTLTVRAFYSENGFQAKMLHHVADDHIALMLDFLCKMSERAMSILDGKDEELDKILSVQKQFINNHMLNWIPQYLELMYTDESAKFYPTIIDMTLEYLKCDKRILTSLTD